MQQSKIIFLLFNFAMTACIYFIFGGSTFESQPTHTPLASNNYAETDVQNNKVNVVHYSDDQQTIPADNTFIDESHDTIAIDNPHLPVAYKTESHQIDPELETELETEENTNRERPLYLEAGQSRTFLYASTDISTDIDNINPEESENFDEHENSNAGYFLQPGQSRTFLSKHEENDYIPEEEK
ncbi:hypothetical protein MNBD_GAMMA06-1741 [hydrothermal vent metagenome]|uniref:Uncharacterized protein n=1 Tax=hydrothermal vent metagenome TaxID=652676 RepID=A0A3B0WII6_9ZZZZ